MEDERFKRLLSAYEVPGVGAEQIEAARRKAGAALGRKIPTRSFSILTQMKVQATYLPKWFYLSCGSLAILCPVIGALTNMESAAAVFFGASPLFILLCAAVFYRMIASGMLEVEAASKYSMTKLFTGRLLILGVIVSVLLLSAGLTCSALFGSVVRLVLLAFFSFTATAAIVLWFGKRSMKPGFVCGTAWSAASIAFAVWRQGRMLLETVDLLFVWPALLAVIALVFLAATRFVKDISFEELREGGNSFSAV